MMHHRNIERSMNEFKDVTDFHVKFGLLASLIPRHLTKRKLAERIECMQEELDEFAEACQSQDLAAQADALVDLVYFALGTAVMLGLPWRDIWDEVHLANISKVVGPTHRGHSVDVRKPDGWKPPDIRKLLLAAGYDPEKFGNIEIDEAKCIDDEGGR